MRFQKKYDQPFISVVGELPRSVFEDVDSKFGDVRFEDTSVFAEHAKRIIGTVWLRKRGRFFSDDIAAMLNAHETYEEAIQAAFVMPAQRLVMVRRGIWEQVASLEIA